MFELEIFDQHFYLLPEKAIFWKQKDALLIADLHFGKAGHFRKSGLPVTSNVGFESLKKLEKLILQINPSQLIFLGDMFHSKFNEEIAFFMDWRKHHHQLDFLLIKGNHDILPIGLFEENNIHLENEGLLMNQFILLHHPSENPIPENHFAFCGHVHPAITISGKGKQSAKLPCFYASERQLILPAFGKFTGTANINPKKNDSVFVVSGNKVVEI